MRLKYDGTRADFVFQRNGQVHLNRRGRQFSRLLASRGMLISGSNAGYTMLEYWLPTPFASFPLTSPPVCHRMPSHFNWTLRLIPVSEMSFGISWPSSHARNSGHSVCKVLLIGEKLVLSEYRPLLFSK